MRDLDLNIEDTLDNHCRFFFKISRDGVIFPSWIWKQYLVFNLFHGKWFPLVSSWRRLSLQLTCFLLQTRVRFLPNLTGKHINASWKHCNSGGFISFFKIIKYKILFLLYSTVSASPYLETTKLSSSCWYLFL